MYKHYGLTGETIKVRRRPAGETVSDPWAYGEQAMRIEAEYPNYLLATVLPHKNPHGRGMSRPYRVCLHKNDIQCGEILLDAGGTR